MSDRLDGAAEAEFPGYCMRRALDLTAHQVELGLFGERISTVKITLPGMTLRELGNTFTWLPHQQHSAGRHGNLVDALGDPRHAEPCVDPHGHRCRTGMGVLAGQRDFQPPQALAMGDDADILAFCFEDRSLLDVEFQHRMHLARADLFVANPANALEYFAEHFAIQIRARLGIVFRVDAANTPEASIAGAKRAPSSLVQLGLPRWDVSS